MKVGRIVCGVILTLLCVFGWVYQISAITDSRNAWQETVAAAQNFRDQKLYQRAIRSYEEALTIREDATVREELLATCALAYEENTLSRTAYKTKLESACSAAPGEETYWVQLVGFLRDSNSYKDAYKALGRAARSGVKGEALDALRLEVTYSYTEKGQYFSQFTAAPDGMFSIENVDRWGTVDAQGERDQDCDYRYISPYSDDGAVLLCTEEDNRLLDRNKVTLAILDEGIEEARAYGDGLLPVMQDGQWHYVNCDTGTELGTAYEDASAYQNGVAAVLKSGTWTLIGTNGAPVSEVTFSGVRLFANGDYCRDGLMSAAVNGNWGLYKTDGTPVKKDLLAKGMDFCLDGPVAYQDQSGLWGFIDHKGNVVLEARYQMARSFSGGLAAVYDGEKWGFINEQGELAIDYQFLDVGYFTTGGACPVSTVDGQFHMIVLRFPGA